MKRWKWLAAVLAVLLAAWLGVSAAHVQAAGKRVVFTEFMQEGKATDFAGVHVQAQYSFDGCLHWDVGYDPGRGGSTQTAVRYDPPHGKQEMPDSFRLSTGLDGMETWSTEEPLDKGIAKMIEQVRTNAPSKDFPYSEVLNAEDDLAELPIRVADAPDWLNTDAIEALFHVPVPGHMAVQVRVFNDVNAELTAVGSGAVECWCDSVVGENAVWFTADFMKGGELWAPGGGVYRAAEDVELLYPLSPESRTRYLGRSEDGARLRLITKENDAFTLTVLDAESGAALQTMALPIAPGDELWSTQEANGDLLMMTGKTRFFLLEEGADGSYALAMEGDAARDGAVNGGSPWRVFCYDGERLALVNVGESGLFCSVYHADGSRSRMSSACSLREEDADMNMSSLLPIKITMEARP